ncbi:Uncharacterised protein [Mycobacteroides abscessus subsp. massiliense]|nr:Uncharacterised protein [Mycobacteroides abscessus subsp. abscessus]SKQ82779.1 Uncharacterised protein [Mycobacteroides abscessus subsp. massiliense]SLC50284.1 Uncharacterised protein [Mycobacteroides abscessus subsp. massiliense]
MAREYRGGAYAPPKTRKSIQHTRIMIAAITVSVIAAAVSGGLFLWRTPAPDRSGEGAEAVHRLLSAQVITASGIARTKDGVQHTFTVDINTHTADALGTWASAKGTPITYVVSGRALLAQVNTGAWTALGLANAFQGWAVVPESLLGTTPVAFEPADLLAAVDAGTSSYAGGEYIYPDGTKVRLRDGDVESVTFKGADFALAVRGDGAATKRVSDTARDAAAARVAAVNDTPAGFTITLPAAVPEPNPEVPVPASAPPAPSGPAAP